MSGYHEDEGTEELPPSVAEALTGDAVDQLLMDLQGATIMMVDPTPAGLPRTAAPQASPTLAPSRLDLGRFLAAPPAAEAGEGRLDAEDELETEEMARPPGSLVPDAYTPPTPPRTAEPARRDAHSLELHLRDDDPPRRAAWLLPVAVVGVSAVVFAACVAAAVVLAVVLG